MSAADIPANDKALALEDLIALNDEIAALIRAGVPLELGLRQFGSNESGHVARISHEISEQMNTGASLSEVMARSGHQFPPLYRRVVEAGLRAGRLPAALEALSAFGRELTEVRHRVGMALVYPFIVIVLAYALFVAFVVEVVARLAETYEMLHIDPGGVLGLLIASRGTVHIWGWIPPIVLLILAVSWNFAPDRWLFRDNGPTWPLSWVPGIRGIAYNYRCANFAQLLSLMVDQSIPLDEALRLAGDASGDSTLRESAHRISERLMQGNRADWQQAKSRGIPPFLSWVITRSNTQDDLARALRLAGEMYRSRARANIDWLKFTFPLVISVVIGGGALLLYGLAFFLPLIDMLNNLSAEAI